MDREMADLLWSDFSLRFELLLDRLQEALELVREESAEFSCETAAFSEGFEELNVCILRFAEYFAEEPRCLHYVWEIEASLEQLFEAHRGLKSSALGGIPNWWEFLEELGERISESMENFDHWFVMTRTPLSFVNGKLLEEVKDLPLMPAAEEEVARLNTELEALNSFGCGKKAEEDAEVVLRGKARGKRKLEMQHLRLLKDLKASSRKGFWDLELFRSCLERATLTGSFRPDRFLLSLNLLIGDEKLEPERSAAFRLCFYQLMGFHSAVSELGYSRSGRFQALQSICHITLAEREELKASLGALHQVASWIEQATHGKVGKTDFDPEKFLDFLHQGEAPLKELTNPGRMTLFHKMDLMNVASYEQLGQKNWQETALQVFTGTSTRRVREILSEIRKSRYWPNEQEVLELMESFKA